jgi:hypothetical protein
MSKQQKRVLDYMKDGNAITSLDAFRELGITRLASVIYDLKNDGHLIASRRKTVENRFNEKCSISEYFYAGEANVAK